MEDFAYSPRTAAPVSGLQQDLAWAIHGVLGVYDVITEGDAQELAREVQRLRDELLASNVRESKLEPRGAAYT